MITSVRRAQVVVVDVPVSVACNRCGNGSDVACSSIHEFKQDFHAVTVRGGYGSTFPEDGGSVAFTLCGGCLRHLVDTFAVPATIEGNGRTDVSYPTLQATDEQDGTPWIVHSWWAHPESEDPAEPDVESAPHVHGLRVSLVALPSHGVYRHVDYDRLVEVVRCVLAEESALVVFRDLEGLSSTYVAAVDTFRARFKKAEIA